MHNSPHGDQRAAENNQLVSTDSPEGNYDQQNVNIPPYNAEPDLDHDNVTSLARPDDQLNANVSPNNALSDFDDTWLVYNPRPDQIHRGESREDCVERIRLQHLFHPLRVNLMLATQAWTIIKGLLDTFYALLPAYRNEKCDYMLAVLYEKAIAWYKDILNNSEKLDRHLREVFGTYSASPHHQIQLPYMFEIAKIEYQRGHRTFSELSRVNMFNSSIRQWVRGLRSTFPWYQTFRTVENARERLAELEEMNVEKQDSFFYQVLVTLTGIEEDVNAERGKFGLLSTPLNALKKEYDDLTEQLRQQYISTGIPHWKIEIPSDENVQRPRISELRSLIENMHKEVTDLDRTPNTKSRIYGFIIAFMAPMSPPPRLPIPEETETE